MGNGTIIMTNEYLVENLLRPKFEIYTVVVSGAAILFAIYLPETLMLSGTTKWAFIAVFAYVSISRSRQAYYVWRYQKNIKTLKKYTLKSTKIPKSKHGLFIGKGFLWTEKHTTRLYHAIQSGAEDYVMHSKFWHWIRSKEFEWSENPVLRRFIQLVTLDIPFNPYRKLPDVGGNPLLHGVGAIDEKPQFIPSSGRPGHMVVYGTTRVGKSRLAETLITQDIYDSSKCVIVFDPKGDADLLKRMYVEAERNNKIDDFYVFNLGDPENSCRYSAIGNFGRITEIPSRVTGGLPDSGDSAAFKEFAWLFVNLIAVMCYKMGYKVTYKSIRDNLSDLPEITLKYCEKVIIDSGNESALASLSSGFDSQKPNKKYINSLLIYISDNHLSDDIVKSLQVAMSFGNEYYSKLTIQVMPLLDKLVTGKVGELISPDFANKNDKRKILDWPSIIRRGGIVYFGLDALSEPEVAKVVGEAAFADLTSYAGHIFKHGTFTGMPEEAPRKTVCIHGDEFNDLLGPRFVPLVNKSGGAGYWLTLYTQTDSDIAIGMGSDRGAGQIKGNIGQTIMLRVQDEDTARVLTSKLPKVNVNTIMAVSGVNDSVGQDIVGFQSRNEDRISTEKVDMISPSDIVSLPIGQAFVLSNGNRLSKIRIPLPSKCDDDELPNDLREMMSLMREKYQSNTIWSY